MINALKYAVPLLVLLTACKEDEQFIVHTTPRQDSELVSEQERGLEFCMPCFGEPHLTLDGDISFFSIGPGITF